MNFINKLKDIKFLLISINYYKKKNLLIISIYLFFTIISTVFEGLSLLLIVILFTKGNNLTYVLNILPQKFNNIIANNIHSLSHYRLIPILLILFITSFFIKFILLYYDGLISANFRKSLQKKIFKKYLSGNWADLNNLRVGDTIGTITQEAPIVAKYLSSIISFLYFFTSAIVMLLLAFFTSFKISIFLFIIFTPLFIITNYIFKIQSKLSTRSSILRNKLSGDITDRLNGLHQVYVDNNLEYHVNQGLKSQNSLNRIEIKIAYCQAFIGSYSLLPPLFFLLIISLLQILFNIKNFQLDLSLVGSIGILGMKFSTQMNGVISAIGNISRLSGSIQPVILSLKLKDNNFKNLIEKKINSIKLIDVNFSYLKKFILTNINLDIKTGFPFILNGRSGKGKTTLANLISGLYEPTKGKVYYVSDENEMFDSYDHVAKTGFVTQDIYLFQASLRDNLINGRDISDEIILKNLALVDALDFVNELGGLDSIIAESGKSLSGGQKRRLGIARVLLAGADVLIFDEITSGLDDLNKNSVHNLIEKISKNFIVIIITHEELNFKNQIIYNI